MYFITSKDDSDSLLLAKNIVSYLKQKGLGYVVDKNTRMLGVKKDINEVKLDHILAIGDDNLILETFRNIGKRQIPLLGIASSQSFLAQSDASSF